MSSSSTRPYLPLVCSLQGQCHHHPPLPSPPPPTHVPQHRKKRACQQGVSPVQRPQEARPAARRLDIHRTLPHAGATPLAILACKNRERALLHGGRAGRGASGDLPLTSLYNLPTQLYEQMRAVQSHPNTYCFNAAIQACTSNRNADMAFDIFADLLGDNASVRLRACRCLCTALLRRDTQKRRTLALPSACSMISPDYLSSSRPRRS